jgi:outer membrane protein TolC
MTSIPPDALRGSVPEGPAGGTTLPLSLSNAIDRGLRQNLGLLVGDQSTRIADAARRIALSALLPTVDGRVSETSQMVNLAAFGFSGFPGIPTIVGPFQVFDARASVSQAVIDLRARSLYRSGKEGVVQSRYALEDARQVVTQLVVNLYLQVLAWTARVQSAEAQVRTAQASYDQSESLRRAGIVPGLDVLRTQVELQAEQQQLISARNEFQRAKLDLARAIGLPLGQQFDLTDAVPESPMPVVTEADALQKAYGARADYQAALAAQRAAEQEHEAARRTRFPSVYFDGNLGTIGQSPVQNHGTYAATVSLQVPIFEGGRIRAEEDRTDAMLEQRRSETADLRGRIDYDVRAAFLDLRSSFDRVTVARSSINLANQQLTQSQDRFRAGVTNSLEVVQSQQAVVTANENLTSSLYSYNLAKASLARAMGLRVDESKTFLGVQSR